nr:MAG TPA: hypothetical protein [Bacteriophage sp.]
MIIEALNQISLVSGMTYSLSPIINLTVHIELLKHFLQLFYLLAP